jgi:hypothetical protein
MKDLTPETLTEFGVKAWGDRNAILKAVKEYIPSETNRATGHQEMNNNPEKVRAKTHNQSSGAKPSVPPQVEVQVERKVEPEKRPDPPQRDLPKPDPNVFWSAKKSLPSVPEKVQKSLLPFL